MEKVYAVKQRENGKTVYREFWLSKEKAFSSLRDYRRDKFESGSFSVVSLPTDSKAFQVYLLSVELYGSRSVQRLRIGDSKSMAI